jgi:outer membrane lipoprotein SlyB
MERRDGSKFDDRTMDTSMSDSHESHATTGGAAAVGAVTGGVIGLTGGPLGAAIGAVGGALIGAAAERLMHGDDDDEATSPTTIDTVAPGPATIDKDRPIV